MDRPDSLNRTVTRAASGWILVGASLISAEGWQDGFFLELSPQDSPVQVGPFADKFRNLARSHP
jgi:hypothetical protein